MQHSKDDDCFVYDFINKDVVFVDNKLTSSFHSSFWGKQWEIFKLPCGLIESIQHSASGIHAFLRDVKGDIVSILFCRF